MPFPRLHAICLTLIASLAPPGPIHAQEPAANFQPDWPNFRNGPALLGVVDHVAVCGAAEPPPDTARRGPARARLRCAAAVPGLLEAGEHAIRLREPTWRTLGLHGSAGDDPVAIQQQSRGDGRPAGGIRLGLWQHRPASAEPRRGGT